MPGVTVVRVVVSAALILAAGGVAAHEHSEAQHAKAQLAAVNQAARDRADELSGAKADRDAARSKLKNMQATVSSLSRQVSALTEQVASEPAPEPVAAPVAAVPIPVVLTDSAALANYLWQACRAEVGAGAKDAGKSAFIAYFHGLERQQAQERAAGRTYYQPDPVAQASEYVQQHGGAACF